MLDDDAVIAESWQQPERFAVLFDRHAAYITATSPAGPTRRPLKTA